MYAVGIIRTTQQRTLHTETGLHAPVGACVREFACTFQLFTLADVLACVRLPTCMRLPTHLHAYACSLAYLGAPACACVYACLHLYVHTPVCVWAHPYVRDNPPAPYPNFPKLPHSGAHYYAPACIRAFPPFALLLI